MRSGICCFAAGIVFWVLTGQEEIGALPPAPAGARCTAALRARPTLARVELAVTAAGRVWSPDSIVDPIAERVAKVPSPYIPCHSQCTVGTPTQSFSTSQQHTSAT
jgi:hypothetical protein